MDIAMVLHLLYSPCVIVYMGYYSQRGRKGETGHSLIYSGNAFGGVFLGFFGLFFFLFFIFSSNTPSAECNPQKSKTVFFVLLQNIYSTNL